MKRIVALLFVLTISGCGLFTQTEPLPPEAPPKTHVSKPTPTPEKVADKVETLHFFATWCGPCKMQKPFVESLKEAGFDITDDDVDSQDSRGNEFNITSVPNYVVLVNGKKKYQTQSAASLGNWLRNHTDGSQVQKPQGKVRNLSQAP
jgi:thioredoxin 1